jgi:methylenetetrahydrofolate reductase (NADPH)
MVPGGNGGGGGSGEGGIGGVYSPREDGYANATELTRALRSVAPFEVLVGVYPEKHPESPSLEHDIDVLKAKIDAGATLGISQFFFEPEPYLRMVEELAALGCIKPVLPGIMPVTNVGQVTRFAQLAGAAFPAHLAARFEALADDPAGVRALGVELATDLCQRLLDEGAPGLHFYTLNRSTATREIARELDLTP